MSVREYLVVYVYFHFHNGVTEKTTIYVPNVEDIPILLQWRDRGFKNLMGRRKVPTIDDPFDAFVLDFYEEPFELWIFNRREGPHGEYVSKKPQSIL